MNMYSEAERQRERIFPWQKKQWHLLQTAFEKNRLSHAYLLSGPEGMGKAAFACAFAEFLLRVPYQVRLGESNRVRLGESNRVRLGESGEDLGARENTTSSYPGARENTTSSYPGARENIIPSHPGARENTTSSYPGAHENTAPFHPGARSSVRVHPDFISLTPEEKSTTIKIDQIRELRHKLSQTAHAGGYQIAVINPADTLPVAASNALLKTLEEPPGRVILFLIDHQTVPMLPTIISRCQKISFSSTDQTDMLDWLQSKFPDEKNLDVLLRLTGCAPLKVQPWIEHHCLTLRDQLFEHLTKCLKKQTNPITPVPIFLKHNILLVLQLLLLLCIDLSRAQFQLSKNDMMNVDLFAQMKTVAEMISIQKLQQFMKMLLETKSIVSRGVHLNAQLCLENLLIEWER